MCGNYECMRFKIFIRTLVIKKNLHLNVEKNDEHFTCSQLVRVTRRTSVRRNSKLSPNLYRSNYGCTRKITFLNKYAIYFYFLDVRNIKSLSFWWKTLTTFSVILFVLFTFTALKVSSYNFVSLAYTSRFLFHLSIISL